MGIAVEHLTKKYTKFTLDDISFDLQEGYILGVAGRNGSGKSTLFHSLLFGECKDGGSIQIDGIKGGREDDGRKEYRRQCAFVLEDFPFPDTMNAKEIGEAFGPWYTGFQQNRYRELLKQLELPEKKVCRKLSAGMKLKVQLAFAFSYDSKVLVLDEPTASLDSFARKDFYELVYQYMEQGDRNVIWATHLTDELDRMADYLLILERGKQAFFEEKQKLEEQYRVVKGSKQQLDAMKEKLLGRIDRETYSEGMLLAADSQELAAEHTGIPTIEQLLCYLYGDRE